MRFCLRKRYVPPYFYRDLQKKSCKLVQGNKAVEEYYEEFEQLKNRIARTVERQPYHDLGELLHLAIQAEQHIKRKVATKSRAKPSWTQPPARSIEKGKAVEVESQFKKQDVEPSKGTRPDQGKFQNNQRTRDITCFKCQGRGHMAKECPNQRVMILTTNGEYESQDEQEEDQNEPEEETAYQDVESYL